MPYTEILALETTKQNTTNSIENQLGGATDNI